MAAPTVPAYSGFGTLLQMGDGATPEEFTTVAGVGDFPAPGPSRDEVEVTSHSSPGGAKEFIRTLTDYGTLAFKVNWLPEDESQTALMDAVYDEDPQNFRVVWPRLLKQFAFAGMVKKFVITSPVGGALTADCEIRVSGLPVFGDYEGS